MSVCAQPCISADSGHTGSPVCCFPEVSEAVGVPVPGPSSTQSTHSPLWSPQRPAPQFHGTNWSLVILDITFLVQNSPICQHQWVGLKDIFQASSVCVQCTGLCCTLYCQLPCSAVLTLLALYIGLLSRVSFPSPNIHSRYSQPRCRIWHFLLPNFIWLAITQAFNLSKSLCRASLPSRETTAPPKIIVCELVEISPVICERMS